MNHKVDEGEPQAGGTSNANLLIEATLKTCVGMCIGGDCKRVFISQERFAAHIAPLLTELANYREFSPQTLREIADQREGEVVIAPLNSQREVYGAR